MGESVGLVLGGGDARGAAHVGLIQAIQVWQSFNIRMIFYFNICFPQSQEAGILIDMVGGVSIGAFMGALWCMEKDTAKVTRKASSWFDVSFLNTF